MKRRFEEDDCTKSTKNDLIKDTPRRCGLKALARKYELIHKADHATENELDISLPGYHLFVRIGPKDPTRNRSEIFRFVILKSTPPPKGLTVQIMSQDA